MRTTTIRRIAAGLAVALASTIGLVALGAPAQAAGSPPVTNPDRIKLFSGEMGSVDLLANDTDADGDKLEVCRLQQPKRSRHLWIDLEGSELEVHASGRASGTYTIVYYACDYSTLTRGTLKVVVIPAPPVRVQVSKIPNRPGKLRVTNKGKRQVAFQWGAVTRDGEDSGLDGERLIGKKRSIVISVRRTAIIWAARNHRMYFGDQRMGQVRGIKLRPRTKVLPPSLPLSEVFEDERSARLHGPFAN